jgi:hypothetical protein
VSKRDENVLAILARRTQKNIWSGKSKTVYVGSAAVKEFMDLYREPQIISEIREGRLRWFGHVERMPQERTVKEVFKAYPRRKKFRWKAKKEMVVR